MNWIEVKLYTTSQAIEPVCAALAQAGVTGVQIEDDDEMKAFLSSENGPWDYVDEELLNRASGEACVKFYLSDNAHGMESLTAVRSAVSALSRMDLGMPLGRLYLETETVDDTDWLNNWKKHYKPFGIGKRVVVRPEWEAYKNPGDKIVFTINPGHVFGTGLHQSTQLCIERLEQVVTKDSDVLDLGCGSGILSIISLQLGARTALAVDIDPNAVDVAYENAALNGVTKGYEVLSGDVLSDGSLRDRVCTQKYNVVVANIVADVIIGLSGFAAECVKDGGYFIASGIIRERIAEVRAALEDSGFKDITEYSKDDWFCVMSRKPM